MENKERIMECALDLFYAKGYDAVGVQEIVEKAGITKPTLYYYFGSKLGLLKPFWRRIIRKFRGPLMKPRPMREMYRRPSIGWPRPSSG